MHVESTQLFKVKAVADMWSVSPATVYRLVESGQLPALRFGTGKGALRVTGEAINAYVAKAAQVEPAGPADAVTVVFVGLNEAQADGRACVTCGTDFVALAGESQVPVGTAANSGGQVFACVRHENRAGEAERRMQAIVSGQAFSGEVA